MINFITWIQEGVCGDKKLEIGLQRESVIVDILNKTLGPTIQADQNMDMNDKVDAIGTYNGRKYLIQIKAKNTGTDMIMEWYRDYPSRPGKDQVTKANIYAFVNKQRDWIYLLDVKKVQAIIR